jgi:hypothetical protein
MKFLEAKALIEEGVSHVSIVREQSAQGLYSLPRPDPETGILRHTFGSDKADTDSKLIITSHAMILESCLSAFAILMFPGNYAKECCATLERMLQ